MYKYLPFFSFFILTIPINDLTGQNSSLLDSKYTLGKELYNLGKYAESIKQMEDIIALDDHYFNAYFRKCYCYYQMDNYKAALREVDHTFEFEQLDERYFYMKAQNYDRLKSPTTALFYMDMAIQFAPENSVYVNHRASIELEYKDPKSALRDYNYLLAQNPLDYSLYYPRGIAKFNMSDKIGACMDWLYARDHDESSNRMFFYKCTKLDLRKYDFVKEPIPPAIEMPVFVAGVDTGFNYFITNNLNYPKDPFLKLVQGMVVARFTLTADRKMTDIEILRSPDEMLSNEVRRVLKLCSDNWATSVLCDGKPIDYKIVVPVLFKITESGTPVFDMLDTLNVAYTQGRIEDAYEFAGKILDINPFNYEVFLMKKECSRKLNKALPDEAFYKDLRNTKAVFYDEIRGRDIDVKLYYNKNYQLTDKPNASYYRLAHWLRGDSYPYDKFYDFTMDSALIGTGSYFILSRDSLFTGYYPNGKLRYEIEFNVNQPMGTWSLYYPNGKLHYEFHVYHDDFDITAYNDSTGKSLLTDGTGKWEFTSLDYKGVDTVKIEGMLTNFKRDGDWKYTLHGDVKLYESYKKGKFQKGVFIDKKVVNYKSTEFKTWMLIPIPIIRKEQLEMDPIIKKLAYDFLKRSTYKIISFPEGN